MTRLAIIRHGPTRWNAEKRLQGYTDIPLSPEGRAMISTWRLPDGLGDRRWVSSPLSRAMETARLLGAPAEVALEPRLKEINYGAWEGRTYADIEAEIGEARLLDMQATGLAYAAPGGESRADLHDRLAAWLAEVAAVGVPVLAFAHQGVIRGLTAMALGWDYIGELPEPFAGLRIRAVAHEFEVVAGGPPVIVRLNIPLGDRAHSD
ncbi:MAG: histidine phosphatase family protein [Alphaproteobacteria bacterium]